MYNVTIKKEALKYIQKLDRPTVKRIRDAIDKIAEDPSIGELLTNHEASYKYRVGGYRILYDVYEKELLVDIIKVSSRGQVYRK